MSKHDDAFDGTPTARTAHTPHPTHRTDPGARADAPAGAAPLPDPGSGPALNPAHGPAPSHRRSPAVGPASARATDAVVGSIDDEQITLRGPAELADALPYLLGYHPTDSVVLVALHGSRGRFGGRVKVGIPRSPSEWDSVSRQLAECLIEGSTSRSARPDGIVLFLCQDPADGAAGRSVVERLRPLAQLLRTACGALDVPVYEALCIADGRFWSYCCPDERCCPPDGTPLVPAGTSVMAAAAACAGLHVRGSQRELEARFEPMPSPEADVQRQALDLAGFDLVSRILGRGVERRQVADETIALARELMDRLARADAPPLPGRDVADDRLITHAEAATMIFGLQDRETRDRAAAWMEGADAEPALRLWRVLARRCVRPYGEHAAAPLTLAGLVSWSTGDEPAARIALGLALRKDPDYVFARLLHEACNQNLDPELVRSFLRDGRAAGPAPEAAPAPAIPVDGGRPPRRAARPQAARPPVGRPRGRTSPVAGPRGRSGADRRAHGKEEAAELD
ncbi:DUF4192 domain-containing protein [Streptomyces sp. NPDC020412]|uniref:DUF4192 domain-containing protein n=1 Tax=Streptomyces sp. NPDC020412 TaxID=3365073 RepID=UPI0037A12A6E